MAEGQTPPELSIQSPAQLPALTNDHAPSIPSPLNPDAPTRVSTRTPKPIVREQREKKDSLKKREAAASGTPGRGATPDVKTPNKAKWSATTVAPLRYQLSYPESGAWLPPRDVVFDEQGVLFAPNGQGELRKVSEQ
jgi:COMPASS component BRE2